LEEAEEEEGAEEEEAEEVEVRKRFRFRLYWCEFFWILFVISIACWLVGWNTLGIIFGVAFYVGSLIIRVVCATCR